MNDLTDVTVIVNQHFIQVAQWFSRQQPECRTIEDVDTVFANAELRAKQGLTKLDELSLPADQSEHADLVREMFKKQIAAYNYGAKRNYKKAGQLAEQTQKLAFAYERKVKG